MIAPLRRLGSLQPGELRFRAFSALRNARDRAGAALAAPRWNRGALGHALVREGAPEAVLEAARRLSSGDYTGAHVALAGHFAQRTGAFPLSPPDLPELAASIRRRFPDAGAEAGRRAARLRAGSYDLLGYDHLPLGRLPDWHLDAVHGRRSPLAFWTSIDYLNPSLGDHKVIWELNRHQHWLALGRAHALTGDSSSYQLFTSQLSDWLAANPPLTGTNWASMLELAFRSLSWLWALHFFAPAAGSDDPEPWTVDLLMGLDRQLAQVERNLSVYFSPNTHLTGEALALYVSGLSLPVLRSSAARAAAGRTVLLEQAERQVLPDGWHAELSTHYHRYSTDFYLLAALVARRARDRAACTFEEAARRQARVLRAMTDDNGWMPQVGDDDGGQLMPICGRDPRDCRDTLAAAAVILAEPDLAVGLAPEETYWLCGEAAALLCPQGRTSESAWLRSSGYLVSRNRRGDHLVVDAGRHGFLNGGHAHADALACTLTVGTRPLLIDPGTATYTMDSGLRDRFRSTMMHNSVVLDGRPSAEPAGPFGWKSATAAGACLWRVSSAFDYIEGTHEGYAPRRHTRAVMAVHGLGWWIIDHVLGDGTALVERYWHIAPEWVCTAGPGSDRMCRLQQGENVLALASSARIDLLAPGTDPLAFCSPRYGRLEPAPTLRSGRRTKLPATFAAFVPATAELVQGLELESLATTRAPGAGWHGASFRVRWRDGAMTMLTAVPGAPGEYGESSAPLQRWGTAGFTTDARAAVLIKRGATALEALLVNGSGAAAGDIRLAAPEGRLPLARLQASPVAPRMQEVAPAQRHG